MNIPLLEHGERPHGLLVKRLLVQVRARVHGAVHGADRAHNVREVLGVGEGVVQLGEGQLVEALRLVLAEVDS